VIEVVAGEEAAVSADSPRRRWPRRAAMTVLAAAVIALVYVVVCVVQVGRAANDDQTRRVDAIVVLGAAQYDGRPSPQLEGRLDHVIELWQEGVAQFVVVTGGNQPGDRFTEAEASRRYLVERGVPDEVILSENRGHTTFESLRAVRTVLAAQSLQSVLIVTDPYHALRSRLTAEEVGLDAAVSPVPDGPNGFRRRVGEGVGVAIGRVIGFGRLSGITG
jgi:uncharacterized SAM-binding protein YcdF (DUF218 family)